MILQKQVRLPILAITFCGLLLTLGQTVLDPNIGKPTTFSFPAEVPLPKWQQQTSRPLPDKTSDKRLKDFEVIAGRHYSYISNTRALDIEMRYLINTNGAMQQLSLDYTSIKPLSGKSLMVIRQAEGVGFYGIFNHNGRAYLSACINPRGGSTVTEQQFADNRDKYALQIGRLFSWVLGQQDLRDDRCLWTLLSTPSSGAAPEPAYQVLEKAWISWHEWWQPRFPKY
jgi:cyanosortase A-associated protein